MADTSAGITQLMPYGTMGIQYSFSAKAEADAIVEFEELVFMSPVCFELEITSTGNIESALDSYILGD